jgi:hypothetical protein
MAKPRNVAPTRQITISTGEAIAEMLSSLAETQLYGSNAAAVAEQLMRLKLFELVDQGKITAPPRSQLPWEQSPKQ